MKSKIFLILSYIIFWIKIFIITIFVWIYFGDFLFKVSLFLFYSSYLFIFSFYIVFISKRKSNVKTSWLLILLFFPFVGFFLYLLFFKKFSIFKKFNAKLENNFIKNLNFEHKSIKLFNNGILLAIDIINEIKKAKSYIYLSYFIFGNGIFLDSLIYELKKKDKEGVKIKILLDYSGFWINSKINKILKKLKNTNIEIKYFNKFFFPFITGKTNYRLHKKNIIIDDCIAFLGGFNIGDNYINLSKKFGIWEDFHCKLEGNIVDIIKKYFLFDFNLDQYKKKKTLVKEYLKLKKCKKSIVENKNNALRKSYFFDSFPNSKEPQLQKFFNILKKNTKKNINISTPYLILTNELLLDIIMIRLSGKNINLLMPNFTDKPMLLNISRLYYKYLLLFDVNIFELKGIFNHSKFWTFDDNFTVITTSNFDNRSFFIDFQSSILFNDKALNKKMNSLFENKIKNSIKITKKKENKLNIFYKLFNLFINPIL